MAYLEIETRNGVQRVALERERLSIGRLASNDIMLPFSQISRQHAEIRRIGGQWWITDLQSTNGLHLNARRIQEHALQEGDKIVFAPEISVRFVGDGSLADLTGLPASTASYPGWSGAAPTPRSVFADDEAPYMPPGMVPLPPARPLGARTPPPTWGGAGSGASHPSTLDVRPNPEVAPLQRPSAPGNATAHTSQAEGSVGGYPVPAGPLVGGGGAGDLYRRSGATGGPAGTAADTLGKLLHICQTCGRLTAPDAVFCQSCHQSIAHECPVCLLNLLPIQDRCPRCHTANAAYVGKAHPMRPDR
jgi:hypothetical protein